MKQPNLTVKGSLKMFALASLVLTTACDSTNDENVDATEDLATSGYIIISDYVPYNPTDQSPEGLAKFAWEEFFALNWQSSWGQATNGAKRGMPDNEWQPTSAYASNYETVWETYAHVTELRPGNDMMQPFDSAPYYSYIRFKFDAATAARPNISSTLFNNLDEDNEIGSCNVYPPNTVEGGIPTELVLYQAKTNRDEYDYILNNYPDSVSLAKASANNQTNILNLHAYFRGGLTNCNCPESEVVICLPCGGSPNPKGGVYEGAIEVKTAWRLARHGENTSTFFTRNNLYYKDTIINDVSKTVYDNGIFVLIGIHIIHKTKDNPEFIFASWQHNGVENKDYQLQLLKGDTAENDPAPFKRCYEVPTYLDDVTSKVYDQISAQNLVGFDIWKNYRLIGVQGKPVDYADKDSDPNYFMANYVIESDTITFKGQPGLANFHGYGFADSTSFYGMNNVNLLVVNEKNFIDAGGCIGCHGVAQTTEGTDFSFLLDKGAGKPVSMPSTINTITEADKNSLKNYLSRNAN